MSSERGERNRRSLGLAKFDGVYILTSLDAECKNHTYVGFTNHPARRIRQHNGELKGPKTKRTSKKRPWEMVLVIYGFPTDRIALQFEWALQNPHKSKFLKDMVARTKGVGNMWMLPAKIRYAYEMLHLPPWHRLPLVVHWFNDSRHDMLKNCPPVPAHVTVNIMPMKGFVENYACNFYMPFDDSQDDNESDGDSSASRYDGASQRIDSGGTVDKKRGRKRSRRKASDSDDDGGASSSAAIGSLAAKCSKCNRYADNGDVGAQGHDPLLQCVYRECSTVYHMHCLAAEFMLNEPDTTLLPTIGDCPACEQRLVWGGLVKRHKQASMRQWRVPRNATNARGTVVSKRSKR
jgi:predicted GIY-YIG superfamily endonuclease